MKSSFLGFLSLSLVLAFEISSLYALDLPPSDQPEVIEKKVRKEMTEALEAKVEMPRAEEEVEERPLTEGRFLVRKIILEGNRQISSQDLEPLIRPYENKQQTISRLKGLTRAINWEYRRRGFLTSLAFIPPQKIEQGRLVIQIIEGKVGDLMVDGNRYFRKKRILAHSALKKGEVLVRSI